MFIHRYAKKKWLNFKFIYVFSAIVWLLLVGTKSQENNHIKSVIENLEKICYFVTWPQNDLEPGSEFVIAVDANDEVYRTIQSSYANSTIKQRKVKVHPASQIANQQLVQVLILAQTVSSIDINKFKNYHILIISIPESPIREEAAIQFIDSNSKMPFAVNLRRIKESGLEINHLLLKEVKVLQ